MPIRFDGWFIVEWSGGKEPPIAQIFSRNIFTFLERES